MSIYPGAQGTLYDVRDTWAELMGTIADLPEVTGLHCLQLLTRLLAPLGERAGETADALLEAASRRWDGYDESNTYEALKEATAQALVDAIVAADRAVLRSLGLLPVPPLTGVGQVVIPPTLPAAPHGEAL